MLGCLAGGTAGYLTFLIGSFFWSQLSVGVSIDTSAREVWALAPLDALCHADRAVHWGHARLQQQHTGRQGVWGRKLGKAVCHHLSAGTPPCCSPHALATPAAADSRPPQVVFLNADLPSSSGALLLAITRIAGTPTELILAQSVIASGSVPCAARHMFVSQDLLTF